LKLKLNKNNLIYLVTVYKHGANRVSKNIEIFYSGKNLILNLHFIRFLLNTWLIESTLQSLTGNWKNHGETEVQKQNSICYLSENKMVRQFSWEAPTQQWSNQNVVKLK